MRTILRSRKTSTAEQCALKSNENSEHGFWHQWVTTWTLLKCHVKMSRWGTLLMQGGGRHGCHAAPFLETVAQTLRTEKAADAIQQALTRQMANKSALEAELNPVQPLLECDLCQAQFARVLSSALVTHCMRKHQRRNPYRDRICCVTWTLCLFFFRTLERLQHHYTRGKCGVIVLHRKPPPAHIVDRFWKGNNLHSKDFHDGRPERCARAPPLTVRAVMLELGCLATRHQRKSHQYH